MPHDDRVPRHWPQQDTWHWCGLSVLPEAGVCQATAAGLRVPPSHKYPHRPPSNTPPQASIHARPRGPTHLNATIVVCGPAKTCVCPTHTAVPVSVCWRMMDSAEQQLLWRNKNTEHISEEESSLKVQMISLYVQPLFSTWRLSRPADQTSRHSVSKNASTCVCSVTRHAGFSWMFKRMSLEAFSFSWHHFPCSIWLSLLTDNAGPEPGSSGLTCVSLTAGKSSGQTNVRCQKLKTNLEVGLWLYSLCRQKWPKSDYLPIPDPYPNFVKSNFHM